MRKMKRFLAIVLAASMLLSTESVSVLATETGEVGIEIVESTDLVENTETLAEAEESEDAEPVVFSEDEEAGAQNENWSSPQNGYRPLPEEANIPVVQRDLYVNEVPQYFASELEAKYITPNLTAIRNQNPYGTCWAFSSIALGELDLLQHGMRSEDLSELHLAYFTYNSVIDPLGGTAGDKNGLVTNHAYDLFNAGGNLMFSAHVLANWMGMTEESNVPYESASNISEAVQNGEKGLADELAYNDVVHLKNAYFLNIKENPEIVKAMIKEYGGVGISYYANSYDYSTRSYPGYNEENNCYYDSGNEYWSNHAVTVVGWDDNFAKENFNSDDQPEGNGAWLVRNSWGSYDDEQNLSGYFWLSYYDPSIEEAAYVFDVTVEGQDDYYDNNYQYDGSMRTSAYGLSGSMTVANVFTAHSGSEYENLQAVSFSTTLVANQSYKVEVYKGLTDKTNPTSGELAASQTGSCIYAGIYTIELDEVVELEAGELFSVVVTIYAAPSEEGAFLDYEISQTTADWYDIKATACEGQSYIYWGYYWKDFGVEKSGNFRIKAFTNNAIPVTGVSISTGNIELAVGETATLSAVIAPEDANNKSVIWSSANESVATVDAAGKVTAIDRGDAVITATTVDGGKTASIMVSVTSKLISISLDRESISLPLNQETTLTVDYNPTDTYTDRTVTWASADENIVSVDTTGKVTANALGSTTITAKVADKEAICVISVIPPQTTVSAVVKASGSVEVSWEKIENCTKYYVYRRPANSQKYTPIAVIEDGKTTYTDTSCSKGVKYYYYVECEYTDESGYTAKSQSEEMGTRQEVQESWLSYSATQDYTGSDFMPTVVVKNGSYTLVKEVDYEIVYVNNTGDDINTYDVTITGIGEYIGSQTITITERKATIQNNMVSEIPEMIFNGGALEPEPTITFNGVTLEKDVDYTLSYANNIDIGTAIVTITGMGHFEGEVTRFFLIRTKTMEAGFVAPIADQEYTGSLIEPNVVLTYNGATLQENVDYRISYSNNTEVGQATATIKGRGNYVGTIKVTFQIVGADLAKLETGGELQVLIEGSEAAFETLYADQAIEPEVALIRAEGDVLIAGKDYEVSYTNNVKPGTATITISGQGNYAGEIIKNFEIRKHDIGEAAVTAGKNLTVLYTPAGQAPVPKVVYNNKRLVEGVDFKAVYYLLDDSGTRVTGTELDKVTDAGKYELVLKGVGTFIGTLEHAATITVKPRALDGGSVAVENPYARIDGDIIIAKYQLLFGGYPLTADVDYTVTTHVSKNRDYVTYVFTGIGNYSGTLTQKFRLIAADIIVFSEGEYKIAAIGDQTYNGERICPSVSVVSVVDERVSLTEGVDYTVSYKYNLNVGTATVIVTGTGDCVGTMESTFKIVPMEAADVSAELDETEFTYSAEVLRPEAAVGTDTGTLREGIDYTVAYVDTEGNPVESRDVGEYQVKVTLKGNYTGTILRDYEIAALPVEMLDISIPNYKYTGTEILPTVEDITISINGKKLTEAQKAGLSVVLGENSVGVSDAATVVISGSGNFTGETERKFSIIEKPISDSDLTIQVVGETITSNATGYEVEWTGNAITPTVEIWNGSEQLVENEDYTLAYRYNTEMGTARIVIYGKGDYQGSRTLYFQIVGLTFSEEKGYEVTIADGRYVYDGTKQQPEVTVTKDGVALKKGVDYNVSYANNINAGTAKVIVSGAGRYTGSISKEFTIVPKTIEDAITVKTSNIAKQRYSGERITPEITIEIDGAKLVEGKDYTTTVLNGVEVGIATLIATGIGNYGGVLAEKQFEIYYTTITYVMNGGVNSASNPTIYTAKDSFTLADPEPRDAYNFAGWYSDKACTKRVYSVKAGTNGNLTFYAKWTPKQVYGIDVSKWQGNIDWNSVKQDGKTFAIVRISYGTTEDKYFETNYAGARNAGIKVGVYCYNTATTVSQAVAQANWVVSQLNGRTLEYPVCLDVEGSESSGMSNSLRTDVVYAFKNVIEKAGYDFMLYASKSWLDSNFDSNRLASLDLWVARYCDYSLGHRYSGNGNVRMWQYTSSGTVSGISGNVDLDVCYEDYVKK